MHMLCAELNRSNSDCLTVYVLFTLQIRLTVIRIELKIYSETIAETLYFVNAIYKSPILMDSDIKRVLFKTLYIVLS